MAKLRHRATCGLSPKLIERGQLAVGEAQVSFEIIVEARSNVRFSLTRRKGYLRIPFYEASEVTVKQHREKFMNWLQKVVEQEPRLQEAHTALSFEHGQTWALGPYKYVLLIRPASIAGASAKTLGKVGEASYVEFRINRHMAEADRNESIEKLLYRTAGNEAGSKISALINEINLEHFRVGVGKLKLSATTSRWGSCSSTGTISLSTRLLAAPEHCVRAVIVHELAHRIEMNHSDRFWKLVYDAMPDYAEADAWLKKHGSTIGWELISETE